MGPGDLGDGRDHAVPGESRLGPRHAVPPGPRQPGHLLRPRGWVPARRGPVRPGVLRDVAAGGARHGRPAAHPAGDDVGGAGAGGYRPDVAAGLADRCVRRCHVQRLRADRRGRLRGTPGRRHVTFRCVGPCFLHLRVRRAVGVDRHRLLVVTGRDAPGGSVAAGG